MLTSVRKTLHSKLEYRLDRAARTYLSDPRLPRANFLTPIGEAALFAPESISWRVFKNPISLFIGGVTGVLLEFANPKVRSGVWDHSTFRTDPVLRLKRTGLAAMMTVYAARSEAVAMIENVNRMHGHVQGVTPDGKPYQASDPALLSWVQATAAFGFFEAYSKYVSTLSESDRDTYYSEGAQTAALYGATMAPNTANEQRQFFNACLPELKPSPIIFDFLSLMRRARAFPAPAYLVEAMLIRAAIDLLPTDIREILGLGPEYSLREFEEPLIVMMARRADQYILKSSPAVQACKRLGLPANYLYC